MLLGLRADRAWECSEYFHGMSPVTSIAHWCIGSSMRGFSFIYDLTAKITLNSVPLVSTPVAVSPNLGAYAAGSGNPTVEEVVSLVLRWPPFVLINKNHTYSLR
jgi:hypothetical protein